MHIYKPWLVWDFCLCRVFLSGSYKPIIPRQKLLLRETRGSMSAGVEWRKGGYSHPFRPDFSFVFAPFNIANYCTVPNYRSDCRTCRWLTCTKAEKVFEWKIRYFFRANICKRRWYLCSAVIICKFYKRFTIGFPIKTNFRGPSFKSLTSILVFFNVFPIFHE